MARKFKFVFIATKKGKDFGSIKSFTTKTRAREAASTYRKRGYSVSRIAKTSKL